MHSLDGCRRSRLSIGSCALIALLVLPGLAGATLVTGPSLPYCDIENQYGSTLAVLGGRSVVVGSAGEFCDFVQALDSSGGIVWSLYDQDHSDFGRVVATIGRDVLVTHLGTTSTEVLRVEPATATVRATLRVPEAVSSSFALVAVNQRVALLEAFGSAGGVIYLLDARSGALLRKVPNPEPGLFLNPVIARVGRRLVISNIGAGFTDGTVSIVDPETGTVDAAIRSREAGDSFGSAIAADGTLIAVGAPQAASGRGAVHLFDRRGRLRRTIVPEDPDATCFGKAVAVRRDAVLIGAPCTSLGDGEEGAAYLYSTRTGALLGRYPGIERGGMLGLNVALLRTAVVLAGRGPDTADNGVVRILPR